jgi:hypothetical protein
MLTRIAAFEARYQLRSPLFAVATALFFLLTFGSVTVDQIQIGARGNVHVNSPFAILQTVAIMCLLGVFVVTAFVANVVIRDDETGFAPILRATRMRKRDYLIGRFLGAMAVALLLMAGVPLAIFVGSLMPWLDPEKLGPSVAGYYLYALFVYALPSLLVLGAGFFAVATATRSMMWTYVGVVAFLVLFITTRLLLRDPAYDTVAALSDPFALSALNQVTKYWTVSERNTQLPPLRGLLLYNRLLWLGASLVLFGIAYAVFRSEARGRRAGRPEATEQAPPPPRPLAAPTPGDGARWQQLAALTRFDMRFVFRSPAFFVLLSIGVFNALAAMGGTVESHGTRYFPVTRVMVETLIAAFSLVPTIVAIYYSGELCWRDREHRIHEIVDATMAPDWTFLVPKVLAVALVLLSCYAVGALTGVGFQLYHRYTHVQPVAYLLWFIVPELVGAVLLAVLSVFVQAVVPSKHFGWAVMMLYVVASFTLSTIGWEHNLYNYAGAPPVPLSDMNGMGRFWIGRAFFHAYWLAFALGLLVAAHLLWRRGAETHLKPRLGRLRHRLHGTPAALLVMSAAVWAGLGGWIYYNTNVRNPYRTTPADEKRLAVYEKTLLPFEPVVQPRITHVQLAVELYPAEARAIARGTYVLHNRSTGPLPEVHVRWSRPTKMEQLEIEGAHLAREFPDLDYRIYAFERPMQPGEQRTLRFVTRLAEVGFPNSHPLTRIVENGTFLNNFELAPSLGFGREGLLKDRAKRHKYGLPSELRPAKLEDQAATANHYMRHDSDFVTAEITLTTDADQVPLAPGYTVSDTVHDGRRTLVTRTEAPILNFFSLQSARYAVKKELHTPPGGQPVELSVYYHPAHPHNVQRMLDAMKDALDVYSQRFAPYQFRQARILEFPAYETFAQAFANTMPYSEGIGFIQNQPAESSDEKIDLVTYVTAHEMGHQWWGHQVIGADKQGMTMLSESFAQYSALLVMERRYGREQLRRFLKGELDRYLRSRGGELVEELPLVRVENQPYIHYQKGSLIMYWLKEVVGEDVVDRALKGLLARYAFHGPPYPSSADFVALLRAEAGPRHDALITDLFEKITLYDMKASDATASRRSDGKYEVRFVIEGRKLYADGRGKETEAPLAEPFDVGVFSVKPGDRGYQRDSVLLLEQRPLRGGRQEVTLVVDREPHYVGVDPLNKRVDRNSDDNLTRVRLQ